MGEVDGADAMPSTLLGYFRFGHRRTWAGIEAAIMLAIQECESLEIECDLATAAIALQGAFPEARAQQAPAAIRRSRTRNYDTETDDNDASDDDDASDESDGDPDEWCPARGSAIVAPGNERRSQRNAKRARVDYARLAGEEYGDMGALDDVAPRGTSGGSTPVVECEAVSESEAEESEPDGSPALSAYELLRQENRRVNQQVLIDLGLATVTSMM